MNFIIANMYFRRRDKMTSKNQRMILKVLKDSERDKTRNVCIVSDIKDNLYRQYALLRGFEDSVVAEGEYLVELNFNKKFNAETPVQFNFLTPNGFLHPKQNICIAQGTFHSSGKEFQRNRIIAGYGLIRQLWALVQYLYAYDNSEEKTCTNWKDSGVNGIGWVNPERRNPELAMQYAHESKAYNMKHYSEITKKIYEKFKLNEECSSSS